MLEWTTFLQLILLILVIGPFALGAVVLVLDAFKPDNEPSDADVQAAAVRYRETYGRDAVHVIGDHMMAATFEQTGRHRRFLKRVSAELQRDLKVFP